MTVPRKLTRPPIAEALIDIRAAIAQSQELLVALADEFKLEFPKRNITNTISAKLEVREGKLVPPELNHGAFHGVHIFNEGGTLAAQFRVDGFTFNNVGEYIGGSKLIEDGLRLWERFAERAHPAAPTRIALRYINKLELPFGEGDHFDRFLAAAPELPEPAPQGVSEFHSRIVANDIPWGLEQGQPPVAVVTQQLNHDAQGRTIVILDIDVFRLGEFGVSAGALREEFETLRELKNRTFFSLLTEEAVRLYL